MTAARRHTEGKDRRIRRLLFGSPRTIPQGEHDASAAMLMRTHRRFLIVLFSGRRDRPWSAPISRRPADVRACMGFARAWGPPAVVECSPRGARVAVSASPSS